MSLTRRLLLAASLVLVVFLGLAGWILDRAFTKSAEAASRDRLQGQIYTLLAATEHQPEGLHVPQALPEARFDTPESGLYARIINGDGEVVWRSPSALGLDIPFRGTPAAGQFRFQRTDGADGASYFNLSFGIVWELRDGERDRYTFQVAEDLGPFRAQVVGFRRNLWGWLGALAVVLLAMQGSILRWGLAPLHRVAGDLERIRSGRAERLEDHYPKEIAGLTNSINAFIASERAQRDRYRHTLGDLAHSLKTPLAVMRSTLDAGRSPDETRKTLREQFERMNQIVEYQLQRAVTSGRTALTAPKLVKPVLGRVAASLRKVHGERGIDARVRLDEEAQFRGDEGDLMEVLGNLLDNAYKWARSQVRIRAQAAAGGLRIQVEDDGPGVPPDQREAVLARGVRADEGVRGHGIGLAIVRDIVEAYDGTLELDNDGKLGGARFTLFFPNS